MKTIGSSLTKDTHTLAEHRFKTTDGLHRLYVQEWGNPQGVPILFLHGGPGAGCKDKHKRYFDPDKHRVIFLDQRGSGNSEPYGSLENNETGYLLEDIELIREKLGIDNWHIEGASWGSSLALCYAIKCPKRVRSLVILGVFLVSKEENDWMFSGQFKYFYPEVWEKNRAGHLDYSKKADQLKYLEMLYPLLGIDDGKTLSLEKEAEIDTEPVKIELYYLKNGFFLEDEYILKNARKLNMPVTIIQGRYDMITPPISAYRLSKALVDCKLLTTLNGHLPSDRESASVLKATLYQLR
ncbi:MAG TPA: alpha/beta fold hydrolase [Candidatus Saccharimonadales bacterium]|nr:alpha/beta fold hydrolase [Candidatus Saccharimonadales bacterium]